MHLCVEIVLKVIILLNFDHQNTLQYSYAKDLRGGPLMIHGEGVIHFAKKNSFQGWRQKKINEDSL